MSTKAVVYPDSNRIGKFNILHEVLQNGRERAMLQALFGLCVVLEAYENESGRGKTFVVASDLFEPLREGEEVPEYRIEMAHQRAFEREDLEQRRVNSGEFGFVAIRKIIMRVPPVSVRLDPQLLH
jgi:hypothetical protein